MINEKVVGLLFIALSMSFGIDPRPSIDMDAFKEMSMERGHPTHICWSDECYPPDRISSPHPSSSSSCKKKDCPTIIINNNNNCGSSLSPTFSCPTGSILFSNTTYGVCDLTIDPRRSFTPSHVTGTRQRMSTLTAMLVTSSLPSTTVMDCDGVRPTMIANSDSLSQFSVPQGTLSNSVSNLFMRCDNLVLSTKGSSGGCTLQACMVV